MSWARTLPPSLAFTLLCFLTHPNSCCSKHIQQLFPKLPLSVTTLHPVHTAMLASLHSRRGATRESVFDVTALSGERGLAHLQS